MTHPPQGGSQPPPCGPPRRSRAGLLAGLVVLGAVVVAAAVLVSILLGATVLDRGAVERDVAGQFQQREGVAVALTCEEDMTVVNGGSYTCTGTTDDGQNVTLTITITDQDADPPTYTWSKRS